MVFLSGNKSHHKSKSITNSNGSAVKNEPPKQFQEKLHSLWAMAIWMKFMLKIMCNFHNRYG